MPIPNDYAEIVDLLVEKTNAGQVHWEDSSFDTSVSIDGLRLSLWAGQDEQTEEPFVAFSLKDSMGANIDSWYVEASEGHAYDHVYKFYRAAKRRASGVPEVLRRLREKIMFSTEIGKPEKKGP